MGGDTINALTKKSHKSYFRWTVFVQELGMGVERKETKISWKLTVVHQAQGDEVGSLGQ